MTMKVLTANRLADGICVWLGSSGDWLEGIDGALVARHAEAEAALEEAATQARASGRVVDINVIDVEERGGRLYPLRLRERIRLAGPTVRTDLGKQAEQKQAEAA
jgi:hypothetical protein